MPDARYTPAMPAEKKMTPAQFIASLPPERREQVRALDTFIRKTVPALTPCLTGQMLGYGPYHYRYDSGREGDSAVIALASQKNHLSLYVCAADGKGYVAERYRARLPKARIGKSCIRFKRVEELDLTVLAEVLREAARLGGVGACGNAAGMR